MIIQALTYFDRKLAPISVDDLVTKVLERLRIFALEMPASPETYKAWSCLFLLADGFLERKVSTLASAAYRENEL